MKLKALPEPKRETNEDITGFFKARYIEFSVTDLRQELCDQLNSSWMCESIEDGFSGMAHEALTERDMIVTIASDYEVYTAQELSTHIAYDAETGMFSTPSGQRDDERKYPSFDWVDFVKRIVYYTENDIPFNIITDMKGAKVNIPRLMRLV